MAPRRLLPAALVLCALLAGLAVVTGGAPGHRSVLAASVRRAGPPPPSYPGIPGWLQTAGTRVVDASGHTVRLVAVNWYGAEGAAFVPGGLAIRPYGGILRTVRSLGFNTIRLGISDELVRRNPVVTAGMDANRALRGHHALDILDTLIRAAGRVGLMVVLVNMRSAAHDPAQPAALWYHNPDYTSAQWQADWMRLARRYRSTPAVVGFDLRNEPHSDGPGLEVLDRGYLRQGATWGAFAGHEQRGSDWLAAARDAGNAILRANPHVLIIVEGVEIFPAPNPLRGATCPYGLPSTRGHCADLYWWGGNLKGVRAQPLRLDLPHHLVYSPHEYGPSMHSQRWMTPGMSVAAWRAEIDAHWGYLARATGPDAAPLWLGEFGTSSTDPLRLRRHGRLTAAQDRWFQALMSYLHDYPAVGWAYWPLNGTHPDLPTAQARRPEPYGLVAPDWTHVSRPLLIQALRSVMPAAPAAAARHSTS